eukprot:m.86307 g.86307  ORF g.86307 m.86307 type:complete len:514 (-) comp21323_c0_seq3:460-2001(-)
MLFVLFLFFLFCYALFCYCYCLFIFLSPRATAFSQTVLCFLCFSGNMTNIDSIADVLRARAEQTEDSKPETTERSNNNPDPSPDPHSSSPQPPVINSKQDPKIQYFELDEMVVRISFFYANGTLSQTQVLKHFQCPWCRMSCMAAKPLVIHLQQNHDRCTYCYFRDDTGAHLILALPKTTFYQTPKFQPHLDHDLGSDHDEDDHASTQHHDLETREEENSFPDRTATSSSSKSLCDVRLSREHSSSAANHNDNNTNDADDDDSGDDENDERVVDKIVKDRASPSNPKVTALRRPGSGMSSCSTESLRSTMEGPLDVPANHNQRSPVTKTYLHHVQQKEPEKLTLRQAELQRKEFFYHGRGPWDFLQTAPTHTSGYRAPKRRRVLDSLERQFYKTPLFLKKNGAIQDFNEDSEDELDKDWLHAVNDQMLQEFVDVNLGEKSFMSLWNRFVVDNPFVGSQTAVDRCYQFVEEFGPILLTQQLRNNFVLHLTNMWEFGAMDTEHIVKVLKKLDEYE